MNKLLFMLIVFILSFIVTTTYFLLGSSFALTMIILSGYLIGAILVTEQYNLYTKRLNHNLTKKEHELMKIEYDMSFWDDLEVKKEMREIIAKENEKPIVFHNMKELMGSIKVKGTLSEEDIDELLYGDNQ